VLGCGLAYLRFAPDASVTVPAGAHAGQLTLVGLGIYFAWLKHDSDTRTKLVGLSVAAVGALVGAWFGFAALSGLGAILTTTVGAAAGGNLALIALDVSRARAVRLLDAGGLAEIPVPSATSV
jgi:hypothetical protein